MDAKVDADPVEPDPVDARPTCDVVLKGGVTSGMVYPTLLCELAQRYRLVNVGGASAGAIAAAVAVAAEFGRQNGGEGYAVLADLPRRLGELNAAGDSTLMALFEPQQRTRPLMTVLRAALRGKGPLGLVAAALGAELWTSAGWWRVLLPASPGALVIAAALVGSSPPWGYVLGVLGLVLVVLGLIGGTAWALVRRLFTEVPANLLGVVDGAGSPNSLTPWLADTIDEAAGRVGGPPLTLADLWGVTDVETKRACLSDRSRRRINLEVMTTNLGEARPQRLPVTSDEWFFDETEFRRLFPKAVVTAMVEATGLIERTGVAAREHDLLTRLALAQGYHRLPLADLPVVVAARLSLSFPVLLSAVPLYKYDFSRPKTIEALAAWRAWLRVNPDIDLAEDLDPAAGPSMSLSRCWISDGGITSNMPVQFFDTPLPERPTFLVNLRPGATGSDQPDVRTADSNRQGLLGTWTDLGDGAPTLPRFGSAIAKTMQNWVDNGQMRMPGYRDRIVTVYLRDGEGGMNLQMDGELIDALGERGRRAAELLIKLYADDGSPGWANNRWVRYRSLMAMLERLFAQTAAAWTADPGDRVPTYREMLETQHCPPSYPFPARALQWAGTRTEQLVELAAEWPEPVPRATGRLAVGTFADGAPRPQPVWRAQPEL